MVLNNNVLGVNLSCSSAVCVGHFWTCISLDDLAGFLCSAFTIISEFGFLWAWMLCERQLLLTVLASARALSTVALGLWLQVMSGHGVSSCASQQWVTHSCKLSFSSKRLKRKASAVLSSCLRKKTSLHTLLRAAWGYRDILLSAGHSYVSDWFTVIYVIKVKLNAALRLLKNSIVSWFPHIYNGQGTHLSHQDESPSQQSVIGNTRGDKKDSYS